MSATNPEQTGDQPNGRQHEQPAGVAQPVAQSLQQQITQALRPVLDDLQQQISQTLRQHMEQAFQQDRSPALAASRTEGQAGDEGAEQSPLQRALDQSGSMLQQTADWLKRMSQTLLDAVRSVVDKLVAAVRQAVVAALGEGVKAAAKPVAKAAISKGVETLQNRGKNVLGSAREQLPTGDNRQEQPAPAAAAG